MFWGTGWVKCTTQLGCETLLLSQGVEKGAETTGKYELQTFLEEKYFCKLWEYTVEINYTSCRKKKYIFQKHLL